MESYSCSRSRACGKFDTKGWHKPTPQAKVRMSTVLASFRMFTAALLALSTCLLYKKCPPCDTSLLVAFYYRGGMQILLDFTVAS